MKKLNIKSLIVVLFAVAISSNSFAQENKSRYVLNGFWDNWYISAGAGAQSYWGSNPMNDPSNIIDRATISYHGALGKWITPYFGLRGELSYTPAAIRYQGKSSPYAQMKIMNAHADLAFNMSHILGGYKDKRFLQVILYGGGGVAASNWPSDGIDKELSLNAGWINKMRLSNRWDLNVELATAIFKDSFDGISSSQRPFDAQFFATGGLTYRFGNKMFRKEAPAVKQIDVTPYNNRIKELENAVSASNNRNAELQKRISELQNQKPVEVKQQLIDLAGASTFFQIGSYKLGERDMVNIEELAAFIKQTPDTKYKLSGLIDYSTGSRGRNEYLCAERVNAVYNALVKFGISESQLVKSTEEPASPSSNPILNRGVVVSTLK